MRLTRSEDVDFGTCDFNLSPVDCYKSLVIDDCSKQENLNGYIFTPEFPAPLPTTQGGKVPKEKRIYRK